MIAKNLLKFIFVSFLKSLTLTCVHVSRAVYDGIKNGISCQDTTLHGVVCSLDLRHVQEARAAPYHCTTWIMEVSQAADHRYSVSGSEAFNKTLICALV